MSIFMGVAGWYQAWVKTVIRLMDSSEKARDFRDGMRFGTRNYYCEIFFGKGVGELSLKNIGYSPAKLTTLYSTYLNLEELTKAKLKIQSHKPGDFTNVFMSFERNKKKRSTVGPCLIGLGIQLTPDRIPKVIVYNRAWEASRRMAADFIFIDDIIMKHFKFSKYTVGLHSQWVYLSAKFSPILSIIPEFKPYWGADKQDPFYKIGNRILQKYYKGNQVSKCGAEKQLIKFFKKSQGE